MSWHLLDKVVSEVSKQSTILGKWMSLLILLRIIALTRIAETLYSDEQAAFKCNTKQPGCENVCFNKFSPISHVRFWSFQLIILTNPPMIFIAFATHAVSKVINTKKGKLQTLDQVKNSASAKASRQKTRNNISEYKVLNDSSRNFKSYNSKHGTPPRSKTPAKRQHGILNLQLNNFESSSSSSQRTKSNASKKQEKKPKPDLLRGINHHILINQIEKRIKIGYIIQSIFRTFLELGFIILHLAAFGFSIKEIFKCSTWPCPNEVDCFVSRPQEKTTVLLTMFGISSLSFVLGLYEVLLFFKDSKGCLETTRRRRKYKTSPTRGSSLDLSFMEGKTKDLPYINTFITNKSSEKSSSSSSGSDEKSLTSIATADLEEMMEEMEIEVAEFDQGQEEAEFV